jgi:flagellar biosynthetic protein FliR
MNELGLLTRLGLLLVRPGTLVMTAPVFGGTFAPPQVKLGLAATLALLLAQVVEVPSSVTLAGLVIVIAREFAIGLSLGMSIRILTAGAELAGQMAGVQIGLSYASVVDPQSGVRNNLLAVLYSSMAIIAFLGIDGHHTLVRAMAESYRVMPVGAGAIGTSLSASVAAMLGMVFTIGLRLAMPVIIVLLIVELALGLVSRVAPAMNLMVIGFPIRVLVGLLALSAAIGAAPGVIVRLSDSALGLAVRTALGFK